jgi:hypothetical protein
MWRMIHPKLIRRKPLKHGKTVECALKEQRMTVCTASMFFWSYGPGDYGGAIIAAADKMLTDLGLGIEYQGSRGKWAAFGRQRLVLVAGDMAVHSEILRRMHTVLGAVELPSTPETAELVAKELRTYRASDAAKLYLAPLGLDDNSFISRQRSMESQLVLELANQLQDHTVDAEALVLGCDNGQATMYRINKSGLVRNHSDIGFVSIGNGGIHSTAHFMFESYSHATTYYRALYQTFKAKKRAEVAPGVGEFTEMFLVNRDGAFPIQREVIEALEKIHQEDREKARTRPDEVEEELAKFFQELYPQPSKPPNSSE